MASTQSFAGDFSSQLHQLNGNHFHGPVSISSPGQNDWRMPISMHSDPEENWKHVEADEGSKSGLSEGLSWEGQSLDLSYLFTLTDYIRLPSITSIRRIM
jgi:hypothetical protein